MNRLLLVVAAAAAALFSAAYADLNWKLTGGYRAFDGQFPYQVSLRKNNHHFCGGSIINKVWILTAAHCVVDFSASSITVVAGTNKLNSGGDRYNVERIIRHKDFGNPDGHNDIALLKIKGNISIGWKVQPIKLETGDVNAGAELELSGWGWVSFPGNVPNDLQGLRVKAISSKKCNQVHNCFGVSVDETQLCSLSDKVEGARHGDSGGPVVYKRKLAGIVSWGKSCSVGYPEVYTRVSSFVSWINKNMK